MSLEADEQQEVRHACRKMMSLAQIMYDELELVDIPPHIRDAMYLEWWKMAVRPSIEIPDFSKLFKSDDS